MGKIDWTKLLRRFHTEQSVIPKWDKPFRPGHRFRHVLDDLVGVVWVYDVRVCPIITTEACCTTCRPPLI